MAEPLENYGEAKRDQPEQVEGYELAPEPPAPPQPPQISETQPSLMEGIDEDADFDADPAIKQASLNSGTPRGERRTMPNPLAMPAHEDDEEFEEPPPTDMLVKPGLLSVRTTLIAGGCIALASAIASFITASGLGSGLPFAALAIYFCCLHAAVGLVALVLVSILNRQPIGSYPLGIARMLIVVSSFMAVLYIRLPYGLSFPPAVVCYFVLVMVFFRVRPNMALRIGAVHAALSAAIQFGFILTEMSFAPTKGEH